MDKNLHCINSAPSSFTTEVTLLTLGNFLTLNSDQATMERNSGLFWAMLQCSLLIGNTFVYFQFQGLEDIDEKTRTTVRISINLLSRSSPDPTTNSKITNSEFSRIFHQSDCCFDTRPFLIDKEIKS